MTKVQPSCSIICPDHESKAIGILDTDPDAMKLGYCFECITKTHTTGSLPKTIRTFAEYVDETSDFYKKCRQRLEDAGEPPEEYDHELSKKGERLEKLRKHIEKETMKVKERFKEIRESILKMIDMKEKECLRLLEEGAEGLQDLYVQFEKLLKTGWIRFADDVEATFPSGDALGQKISRISSLDQLQALTREVNEDIQIKNSYSDGKNGLQKRKNEINRIISGFKKIESSLPEPQGKLLNSKDLEGLMKELLKEFNKQEFKIENSIPIAIKELSCGSQIIDGKQYAVLESWLSDYNNLNLKLLYRGSVDGMSAQAFHNNCDGKGATVTLVKCKFDGAVSSSVIGGFIDQSWHSTGEYTASKTAFLFSLTSGVLPVKCPIQQAHRKDALLGQAGQGPIFGSGYDLYIKKDFMSGSINPNSYSNADALYYNNKGDFAIEEIEVWKVQ